MPLPPHLPQSLVYEHLSPLKDVDGITPVNAGRMHMGLPGPAAKHAPGRGRAARSLRNRDRRPPRGSHRTQQRRRPAAREPTGAAPCDSDRLADGGRAGVLTVLAGAACAAAVALAAPSTRAAQEAPFLDWNPLLPGFATPYRPSRERDCVDGSNACIEETLTEMYRRFDRRYATCDHNSAFGITYIRVTEAIRRTVLKNDLYVEPKYLNHEDKVFARMYFNAFDAWARGDRAKVPPAWQEALDAGRDRTVSGQGNLLMSMNAHINRDMPFLLEALGLTDPKGTSRKPDHDRGNRVLHPLYDDVLRELAARYDPTIDDIDAPGTLYDDTAIFQILQGWREGVWRNAELLAAADTIQQRRAAAEYIENYALDSGPDDQVGHHDLRQLGARRPLRGVPAHPSRARRAGRAAHRPSAGCAPGARASCGSGSRARSRCATAPGRSRSPAAGAGWPGPPAWRCAPERARCVRVRLTKRARRVLARRKTAGGARHGVVAVALGHHADGRRARPAEAPALAGLGPEQVREGGAQLARRLPRSAAPSRRSRRARWPRAGHRSRPEPARVRGRSASPTGRGPGCILTRARSIAYLVTRQRPSIWRASRSPSSIIVRTAGGGSSSSAAASGMP